MRCLLPRYPTPPRRGRAPAPVAASLLLGLLAWAPGLAAQELVSGAYSSPIDGLYLRPLAEEYRQRKVRTVLVTQQAAALDEPGRPLVLRPVSYQEVDLQGRMTSQSWAEQGVLGHRREAEYGPAGELQSITGSIRLANPADTTRLGQVWLPESYVRYPATPGTGTRAQWNAPTGDWQPTEHFRQWLSHDTTYLATTNARTGQLTKLDRTYYFGPGQRLWRHDELLFDEHGLEKVSYSYLQLDKKRLLETGQLDFELQLIDYVTTHPDAVTRSGYRASLALRDALARRAAGRRQPELTRTFDARGWLVSQAAPGHNLRTVYQRNARGQLQQCRHYRHDKLSKLVRFVYLPNGLLARASSFDEEGQLTDTLRYRYRYY